MTVPGGVLVEAWRGGAQVARLLEGCIIETLDEPDARAAGLLLGQCSVSVEAIDATVVEGALRRGDAVVTSNRSHLPALASDGGRAIAIVDI